MRNLFEQIADLPNRVWLAVYTYRVRKQLRAAKVSASKAAISCLWVADLSVAQCVRTLTTRV